MFSTSSHYPDSNQKNFALIEYSRKLDRSHIQKGPTKSYFEKRDHSKAYKNSYDYTKRSIPNYLFSVGIIFSALLGISRIIFPKQGQYSMQTHMISYLGDFYQNPWGWWIFSISLVFLGFSIVSLVDLITQNIGRLNQKSGMVMQISGKIAGVSLAVVGIFPDSDFDIFNGFLNIEKIHILSAEIFFIMLFVFVFSFVPVLLRMDQKQNPNQKQNVENINLSQAFQGFKILYIIWIFLLIQTFLTLPDFHNAGGKVFMRSVFSVPMWEWSVFLTFLFTLYAIGLYCYYFRTTMD